jgi:hypothetical protein
MSFKGYKLIYKSKQGKMKDLFMIVKTYRYLTFKKVTFTGKGHFFTGTGTYFFKVAVTGIIKAKEYRYRVVTDLESGSSFLDPERKYDI